MLKIDFEITDVLLISLFYQLSFKFSNIHWTVSITTSPLIDNYFFSDNRIAPPAPYSFGLKIEQLDENTFHSEELIHELRQTFFTDPVTPGRFPYFS